MGEIVQKDSTRNKPIRVLLDSGTSSTILLKEHIDKTSTYKKETTKWKTMGGTFFTKKKAQVTFKLPEFS